MYLKVKRKNKLILGITGIRSEYDIMSSVFREIANHSNLDLRLIVTGAHLSEKYGLTIKEIRKDKFKISDEIESLLDSDTDSSRVIGLSIQVEAMTRAIKKIKPDILLVLGDREESLAVAIVGTYLSIPVAHISGGDKVVGNIDDHVRHSVTKLAHIHFPTSEDSKKRILKMGEEKFRVFNVGNPGLDRLRNYPQLSRIQLSERIGFDIKNEKHFLVLIQHPLSSEFKKSYQQMRVTLSAIIELGLKTVVIYPNSDAGSEGIIKAIDEFKNFSNIKIFKNIPRLEFINLLRIASCLVGNSSCGILEAPFLKLPVVNVGNRQKERMHAKNVSFVSHNKHQIMKAINKSLSLNYKNKMKKIKNPFGNGKSSGKIANILSKIRINKKLLNKEITY